MGNLRDRVIRWTAIGFSLFTVFEVITLILPPLKERSLFLVFALMLSFLLSVPTGAAGWKSGLAWTAAGLAALTGGYLVVEHDALFSRVGDPTTLDLLLGTIAIVLVLEGTRRAMGWALPLLAVAAILYAAFGNFLPDYLAPHGGYQWDRIVGQSYATMEGIYGLILYVIFYYVFLFVLFGTFLEATGATDFLLNLSRWLFGGYTAGPAKMSVLTSGMIGTVSGSAVANVVTDGTFTIPLMKRSGFSPAWAAAVEAATSTGGALVPPVMGAAAFLMAEFLGISYVEICKAAVIPAILYYVALFACVHFYGQRMGIVGLPRQELPSLRSVFADWRGVIFFLPLLVLITMLALGFSPTLSILSALPLVPLTALARKETRFGVSKLLEIFEKAGKDMVVLVCSGACVGLIMGLIMMTGVGNRLSSLIVELAEGQLVIALVLVMTTSLILGMGLTTTICYILLATLVAPALVQMGADPLAAHLFIFYFGMISMITPPVAMASYAAATLARSPIMETGFIAFRLAISGFILPYIFIYNPALLFRGSLWEVGLAFASGVVGVIALGASMVGHMKRHLHMLERAFLFVGALLLIKPGYITDMIGLAIILSVYFLGLKQKAVQSVVIQEQKS